jgi:hypothetical protein
MVFRKQLRVFQARLHVIVKACLAWMVGSPLVVGLRMIALGVLFLVLAVPVALLALCVAWIDTNEASDTRNMI